MNSNVSNDKPFELSIDDAKMLAQKFRATNDCPDTAPDPLKEIAPSLLSADHIIAYVKETGLIAPFNADTGKGSRLKKASYEARLGKDAYYFEVVGTSPRKSGVDPKLVQRNSENNLVLPPNSIVFVECDLEFRLPPFIALRFNLSISHVHRGLLLGTGPLVDPGFWGKLCIPIHNLTDEPYEIEDNDGLIYIEFTKITASTQTGRLPSGDGKWDIREFIDRATKQVDKKKDRVGIRSGISQALKDSEDANKKVEIWGGIAQAAAGKVANISFWGLFAGGVSLSSVVISVLALTAFYYSDMNAQYDELRPSIEKLTEQFNEHTDLLDTAVQSETDARSSALTLSETVTNFGQSLAVLTNQMETERTDRREMNARLLASEEERARLLKELNQMKTAICSDQTDGEISEFCSNLTAESVD